MPSAPGERWIIMTWEQQVPVAKASWDKAVMPRAENWAGSGRILTLYNGQAEHECVIIKHRIIRDLAWMVESAVVRVASSEDVWTSLCMSYSICGLLSTLAGLQRLAVLTVGVKVIIRGRFVVCGSHSTKRIGSVKLRVHLVLNIHERSRLACPLSTWSRY